ncbi:MAG: DUF3341 domain-containing protein [Candidatus Krumholzibacteriia bacterium]
MLDRGPDGLYGVMAEFERSDRLIAAVRAARAQGYRRMDAYSPYPIAELSHALGHRRSVLPWIVLGGGIFGGLAGFFLQYWTSVIAYPLNVGGRPFNSWPAFVPVSFECTILVAAMAAVFGMLALNGLPMPHHPVFNVQRFALASRNRYFLCIEAEDPKFDAARTADFLWSQNPTHVAEVALS